MSINLCGAPRCTETGGKTPMIRISVTAISLATLLAACAEQQTDELTESSDAAPRAAGPQSSQTRQDANRLEAWQEDPELVRGYEAAQAGDYQTALQAWTPLAEDGNPHAQANLAVLFEQGLGVSQNVERAAELYASAAEEWHPIAQTNLAIMHRDGVLGEPDQSRAVALLSRAAGGGYSPARYLLGRMYVQGDGVEQDYAEAAAQFQDAADDGHAGARNMLAIMHADGLGVETDLAVAHMWFSLAGEAGEPNAAANRARLEETMSAEDLDRARAMLAARPGR